MKMKLTDYLNGEYESGMFSQADVYIQTLVDYGHKQEATNEFIEAFQLMEKEEYSDMELCQLCHLIRAVGWFVMDKIITLELQLKYLEYGFTIANKYNHYELMDTSISLVEQIDTKESYEMLESLDVSGFTRWIKTWKEQVLEYRRDS